jgi:hypothetical protein
MKKYRPSNGTEGMGFTEHFCDRCINQHPDPDNPKQCMILCRTMVHDVKDKEYPEEWTYDDNGRPTCTAWKKWDWGRDDDGNWIDPPEMPPDDPNQLCFPFLFDELEIPKIKKQTQST